MTSTEAERFQSKFRREPRQGAGSGTRDRRRVFEGSEERTSAISSVTGTAGRYRSLGDRSEKTEKSETVTSRLSKLNTNDDSEQADKDKEEEAASQEKKGEEEGEESSRKSHKKDRGGASVNATRKRQARKNLREKRRSTGVVIMPGQPVTPANEEEQAVQENTAMNTEATASSRTSEGSGNEDTAKQLEAYEIAIEEWKDELAKAKKEIEALQKDNQRLKDENSALLRVVGSLSGPRR